MRKASVDEVKWTCTYFIKNK